MDSVVKQECHIFLEPFLSVSGYGCATVAGMHSGSKCADSVEVRHFCGVIGGLSRKVFGGK